MPAERITFFDATADVAAEKAKQKSLCLKGIIFDHVANIEHYNAMRSFYRVAEKNGLDIPEVADTQTAWDFLFFGGPNLKKPRLKRKPYEPFKC